VNQNCHTSDHVNDMGLSSVRLPTQPMTYSQRCYRQTIRSLRYACEPVVSSVDGCPFITVAYYNMKGLNPSVLTHGQKTLAGYFSSLRRWGPFLQESSGCLGRLSHRARHVRPKKPLSSLMVFSYIQSGFFSLPLCLA
jgi:hypothetical protein